MTARDCFVRSFSFENVKRKNFTENPLLKFVVKENVAQ